MASQWAKAQFFLSMLWITIHFLKRLCIVSMIKLVKHKWRSLQTRNTAGVTWFLKSRALPISCDSQLLSLFHDLASVLTETVPHRRLLYKLEWSGIRGGTLDWIKCSLTDRSQRVVLDGTESLPGPVLSGVPQGSVLGLISFLIYNNDLPDGVTHSTVRMFTDDCILYRHVADKNDINRLQMDLDRIAKWEETWWMEFNVGKSFAMRVGRQRDRSKMYPPMYILHIQVLCITDTTKYLRLTITSDLK